jgi:hypothetical protein
MRPAFVLAWAFVTGCSQVNPTTFDISVIEMPSADPNHRETQVRFKIPPESTIRVVAGSGSESHYTDLLNSDGTFAVRLVVTRHKPSDDGSRQFTTFVHVGRPEGKVSGGHPRFTFAEDRSFDDVLKVTAASGSVPLGVPHRLGTLNGEPITLFVQPGVGLPRLGAKGRLEFATPSVGSTSFREHSTHHLR